MINTEKIKKKKRSLRQMTEEKVPRKVGTANSIESNAFQRTEVDIKKKKKLETTDATDIQSNVELANVATEKNYTSDANAPEAENITQAAELQRPSSSILTNQKFSDLPLHANTLKALTEMGFEYMTEIQAKSIPECLAGSDLVGAAVSPLGIRFGIKLPI